MARPVKLHVEVWEENAKNKTNELFKCPEANRQKAVKILMKILGNIQANPGEEKFQNIVFSKMMKKFEGARPGLHILFAAGFEQTVDGSKIVFNPRKKQGANQRLTRVLEILANKVADPDPSPEPAPAKPKKKPVKKEAESEPNAMDVDPKPVAKPTNNSKSQLMGIDLELGEAVVLFGDADQAKMAASEYNGAEIDNNTITVELFFTGDKKAMEEKEAAEDKPADASDDKPAADPPSAGQKAEESHDSTDIPEPADKPAEAEPAPDANDVDMAPAKPEATTCKIKITGLSANVTKPTLKTLLTKLPSGYMCAVAEILYRKKRGRGEALGGGAKGDEVGDDLLANIKALKGNHTRIAGSDLTGKTAEEKKKIIEDKRAQYRRDKATNKTNAAVARQKNDNFQRKAALELQRKNEQYQMEKALREKKREKERQKAAKAKIRAKIAADKERRKREKEARERAKKAAAQ